VPDRPIRVVVWNEYLHEREDPAVQAVYPAGIHTAIASALRTGLGEAARISTATLDQPEHGLSGVVLDETDVLLWWGHMAHQQVAEEVAERVRQRVLDGMGLVVLHSAHESKPFKKLMGTSCALRWRESDDREVVWTVSPSHPIAEGVPHALVLPKQEMYGEYFDIPQPDELIFISWFTGGEVFRSGCTFTRGLGRIFYFSPGHETYPVYHDAGVRRILVNAVKWAQCSARPSYPTSRSTNAPVGWFQAP